MAKLGIPKRIILKVSGEAFGDGHEHAESIASNIQLALNENIQVGVVVGGGNIFRGAAAEKLGFQRAPADYVGMLATAINGLILSQALHNKAISNRVMSSFAIPGITERYHWQQARDYLGRGDVVIFVGGTGNPFFTTDTTGALRASEVEADLLLKATKVDGIYDKDPKQHSDAQKFDKLTYAEALTRDLKVMDGAAIALCRDNQIPIYVFNLFQDGALKQAICHQEGGTLVSGETA